MSEGLPAGWSRACLKDLFATITDGDHLPPPQTEEGVPFVVIGNVAKGRIDFTDTRYVSPEYFASLAPFRRPVRGDVLYTVTGYSLGIPVPVDTDREFCVQRHIAILKPASLSNSSYLAWALNSRDVYSQAASIATGTAQKTVGLKGLREIEVPVPPSEEQGRIVGAIESYLTRLDDAVAGLQRAQRKLKQYRASVLKAAMEGRLVPTEAELARAEGRDYEHAQALLQRILSERRHLNPKAKEPICPDTKNLPVLPEGWCWSSLDALIISGPQNGIYQPKDRYGRGIPIVRIDDYQAEWSRSSDELQKVALLDEEAARYSLSLNDLLINRVNSPTHLGKTLRVEARHVPAVFESNIMKASLTNRIEVAYIAEYLNSRSGRQCLVQNAKWAVNQASINTPGIPRLCRGTPRV